MREEQNKAVESEVSGVAYVTIALKTTNFLILSSKKYSISTFFASRWKEILDKSN
ncbi:hypothetical protein GCM10010230_68460 [Streptomyces narbonensis]|nr:hypothetical protein GCM10010230_68460 [Streptomyces narbonensis]